MDPQQDIKSLDTVVNLVWMNSYISGYVLTFMGLLGLLNLSTKAVSTSTKVPKNVSDIEFTTINSANA